jgi:hypothetical protein
MTNWQKFEERSKRGDLLAFGIHDIDYEHDDCEIELVRFNTPFLNEDRANLDLIFKMAKFYEAHKNEHLEEIE